MNSRDHAILSPSFMHVALKCSASVGMKEGMPREAPEAHAIRGTKIHEVAKGVLEDWLNHKTDGTSATITLDKEPDPEIRKVALEWRDAIWEYVFEKSITGKIYGIEDRLVLSEALSLWGTTDFWLVAADERAKTYGVVSDLKSGFVFVDADENEQTACYACALRAEVRKYGKDLDYVIAAIFQPFAEGDKWRQTKYTSKQLDVWEKKFFKLADSVFTESAKFKAGEHCQYCPAKVRCDVYDKYRVKETGLVLKSPEEIIFPEVPAVPDDVLVRIVRHEKQLTTFVKACRKELLNKLMSGAKVPGVKLVKANTKRRWDPTRISELGAFLQQAGVNLFAQKTKGLGETEEQLAAVVGKKEAKQLLSEYLVKPEGGIVLADVSDKRDEVLPGSGLFIAEEEYD